MNKRKMVYAAAFFMLGIFLAAVFDFYIAVAASGVLMILALILKRKGLVILFIIAILGSLAFTVDYRLSYTEEISGNAYIKGRVTSITENKDNSYKYLLKDIEVNGKQSDRNAVIISDNILELGDMVYSYGAVSVKNYEPFDSYSMSYYKDKVSYVLKAEAISLVSKDNLNFFEKITRKVRRNIEGAVKGSEAQVSLALFLGDKSQLDEQIQNDVNILGMAHIFSVSGLHIIFLSAAIFFLCKKLRLNTKISFIITLAALFIYGMMTGFPVAMIRASLMLIIMLIAELTFKRYDNLNSLALAALLILIFSPMTLFELGFQMSFSSVLGIICFYTPIKRFFYKGNNKILQFIANSVALTLSANAILAAVAFNTFSRFGIYFLLSNLILLPFVSVIFMLTMIFSLIVLILPFMQFILIPIRYPAFLFIKISSFMASLPYAAINISHMGIYAFIYTALLLFMSKYVILDKKYKLGAAVATIGFSVVLLAIL